MKIETLLIPPQTISVSRSSIMAFLSIVAFSRGKNWDEIRPHFEAAGETFSVYNVDDKTTTGAGYGSVWSITIENGKVLWVSTSKMDYYRALVYHFDHIKGLTVDEALELLKSQGCIFTSIRGLRPLCAVTFDWLTNRMSVNLDDNNKIIDIDSFG
jgi:hypothetical protein